MILQSLCQYYERKAKDPDSALAPFGFEEKNIPFLIVINEVGEFVQIEDTREMQGKKLVGKSFLVPKGKSRSGSKSYEVAYCLWDHYGYILKQSKLQKPVRPNSLLRKETGKRLTETSKSIKDKKQYFKSISDYRKTRKKAIADANNQHSSMIKLVYELKNHDEFIDDIGISAAFAFLKSEEQIEKVKQNDLYQDVLKIKGCNLAFKLAGQNYLLCQSQPARRWVKSQSVDEKDSQSRICLITGDKADVIRLHPPISGVNAKPAPFSSVNSDSTPAFDSYEKRQGFNFPVSNEAAFKYTTALSSLLAKTSQSKFSVGDTKYICWAAKENHLEQSTSFFFNDHNDAPDKGAQVIKQLMNTLHNGAYQNPDGNDEFFLLGLSPNSARISVRFWQKNTVAEFSERLGMWFDDLNIHGREHYGYSPLKPLLKSIVFANKEKNIPPNLIGEVTRSILAGTQLPVTLINAILRRVKAEQGACSGYNGFHRVSLLKAYLNRKNRFYNFKQQEVTVSLNQDETRIGYCLGRLFSALEKLQEDAHGGKLNSTIRDRYYSSASSTPKTVFGTLMRLSTHHFKKLDNPAFKVVAEKRIGEIMALIPEFPAHLNLDNQGLFAIGYYHQKQAFFKKKPTDQGE